jgi:hypothetical protein
MLIATDNKTYAELDSIVEAFKDHVNAGDLHLKADVIRLVNIVAGMEVQAQATWTPKESA